MKKLMFALVAAGAAAVMGDAIESQNVVGYNTVGMTTRAAKATYNMMAVPFTGTSTGFRLNYDLSVANATGSTSSETSDLIQIWDPTAGGGAGGYEQWYYYYDSNDKPIAEGGWNGWWDYLTGEHAFEEAGYHPEGLEAGATFWYLAYNSAATPSMTVSGQVLDTASKGIDFYKGKYNMVTCPYPIRLKLNDATQVEWTKCTGSASTETSDLIQIWDPTAGGGQGGYEQWYYYYDSKDKPIAEGGWNGWWDYLTAEHAFEEEGYHPNGLDVGKPFWYKAAGTYSVSDTGLITFFSPVE